MNGSSITVHYVYLPTVSVELHKLLYIQVSRTLVINIYKNWIHSGAPMYYSAIFVNTVMNLLYQIDLLAAIF